MCHSNHLNPIKRDRRKERVAKHTLTLSQQLTNNSARCQSLFQEFLFYTQTASWNLSNSLPYKIDSLFWELCKIFLFLLREIILQSMFYHWKLWTMISIYRFVQKKKSVTTWEYYVFVYKLKAIRLQPWTRIGSQKNSILNNEKREKTFLFKKDLCNELNY